MFSSLTNIFVSAVTVMASALTVISCNVTLPQENTFKLAYDEKVVGIAEYAYTVPSFELKLTLPDGWTLGEETDHKYYANFVGTLTEILDENGSCVGSIGSKNYSTGYDTDPENIPAPLSENYWQAVYPELRLPARRSWDIFPKTSIKTQSGETMLARVYTQIPEDHVPAAAWETVESLGIVSYNDLKHIYVFIELDETVGEDVQKLIAESISID